MRQTAWSLGILAAACAFMATGPAAFATELTEPTCEKAKTAAFEATPIFQSRPKTIVAIGSSSTEGIARNARDKLYPATLEAKLRQRWPQADLRVVNKGRGGEVMADTLKRFETDVIALKPSLVVWQLGVNDVLRFQGIDGRQDEMRAGLKMLADNGIPVILLDLQYAAIVNRDPDTAAMQELIDSAARNSVRGRVYHFRRYAIMKELAERQDVPASAMIDGDGLHMTDAMHACVGSLLADMIAPMPSTVAVSARQSAER